MKKYADFFIRNCGSIIMLIPATDEAKDWTKDNINIDEWQNPNFISIEARSWDAIAEGIQNASFSYKFI